MTDQEYISLISREPTLDMVKQGRGYKYIKKSILQKELLTIYSGHTKWEMLRDTVSKNGLWGTGLLSYKHPVSGEWLYVSGTASIPHLKVMQLNYPNLEAHAYINACKKIGVWFGQTLNIDIDDLPFEEMDYKDDLPIEPDLKIKKEYEEIEKKLKSFKYQQEAQEYLDTTTFKMFIPAKQIVNSKPIKK